MSLNNTDGLCFPCAAYELRHSLGLALLTKWRVLLQNAFSNPAYVNQTILKLRQKRVRQPGGQAKIWGGMAHPAPTSESPLARRRERPSKRHLKVTSVHMEVRALFGGNDWYAEGTNN